MRLLPLLLAASAIAAAEPWSLPEPLCCSQGFRRRAEIATGAVPAATVQLRLTPAERFAGTLRPLDADRLELRLEAQAPGRGQLELLDAAGTVRLRRAIQVVALGTDSEKTIRTESRLPDGSTVFGGNLLLRPHQPGLDVRFVCLSRQVTVPDGLGERWIASETFAPDGEGSRTSFRMVREPGARWVPFTYILYQDGEQISAP